MVMADKCSCCGERDADLTFPGITAKTRDLAGRPIASACFSALLGEGKGARELAERIRARDAALAAAGPEDAQGRTYLDLHTGRSFASHADWMTWLDTPEGGTPAGPA